MIKYFVSAIIVIGAKLASATSAMELVVFLPALKIGVHFFSALYCLFKLLPFHNTAKILRPHKHSIAILTRNRAVDNYSVAEIE